MREGDPSEGLRRGAENSLFHSLLVLSLLLSPSTMMKEVLSFHTGCSFTSIEGLIKKKALNVLLEIAKLHYLGSNLVHVSLHIIISRNTHI